MQVAAKMSVAMLAPTNPNMLRENSATVSPLREAVRRMT